MSNSTTKQTIPNGWQHVKLGTITSVMTGKRDANHGSPSGRYPFFTCAQKVSRIDDFSFDTEAVLVAGNGDFNVKYYQGKFDAYQRTYVLSDFEQSIGRFLYYKVKQALFEIIKNNQGSSVKFIKKGDLTDYSFSLPPLSEQKKIAEILGAVDEEIQKTDEIIAATEKLKRGLMQRLFTRGIGHTKFKKTEIGEIPSEWAVSSLGDIATINRGGSPRPINSYITEASDGLNWLRIGDIEQGGKYVTRTSQKIKKEGLSKTTLVKKGDFILSNSMSFGRPYIMKINACIHDGWLAFREIDKQLLDTEFLYYLLSSDYVQRKFYSASAGSGVKNLKKESVSGIVVAVPNINEQKKIAEILASVDEKIIINQKLREKLTFLKKGLMEDLLGGKVRVEI